jgi:hypothetical protein
MEGEPTKQNMLISKSISTNNNIERENLNAGSRIHEDIIQYIVLS